MKRAFKATAVVLVFALGLIQLFQIDKTNPEIKESETIDSVVAVPPDVKIILGKACNDCHTNNTRYPWYSYIQPNGWWMRSHIEDGRRHLNLSIFATYDAKKRSKKLEEICDEVRSGEMPLPSYTWIHRDAVLSSGERDALCEWANKAAAALTPQ